MKPLVRERLQHSFLAKSFHWLFVFVFGYGVFKQIQSKDQLNDIELLKSEMLFAVIFLSVIILLDKINMPTPTKLIKQKVSNDKLITLK